MYCTFCGGEKISITHEWSVSNLHNNIGRRRNIVRAYDDKVYVLTTTVGRVFRNDGGRNRNKYKRKMCISREYTSSWSQRVSGRNKYIIRKSYWVRLYFLLSEKKSSSLIVSTCGKRKIKTQQQNEKYEKEQKLRVQSRKLLRISRLKKKKKNA